MVLHVTHDANCYVACWTFSTGPVLNRRSHSAEKYWIGPIYFLLDRAFSKRNGRTDRQMTCDRNTALCTIVHCMVKWAPHWPYLTVSLYASDMIVDHMSMVWWCLAHESERTKCPQVTVLNYTLTLDSYSPHVWRSLTTPLTSTASVSLISRDEPIILLRKKPLHSKEKEPASRRWGRCSNWNL